MTPLQMWREGEALPPPHEMHTRSKIDQPVMAAAWADLRARLEAEGWKFQDIDRGFPGVVKIGGIATVEGGGLKGLLADFEATLLEVFGPEAKKGLVLVRSPLIVVHDGAHVRGRFGWAQDEASLKEMMG